MINHWTWLQIHKNSSLFQQSIKPTFLQKKYPCKPCWTGWILPIWPRTKNVWARVGCVGATSGTAAQSACARQYMVRQAGCWASPPAHPPFPSLCDSANLFRLSTGSAGGFGTKDCYDIDTVWWQLCKSKYACALTPKTCCIPSFQTRYDGMHAVLCGWYTECWYRCVATAYVFMEE